MDHRDEDDVNDIWKIKEPPTDRIYRPECLDEAVQRRS